jgi:aspartate 1-decarboxylase
MKRRLLIGKIHRATVTQADLDYEGSVTLDADLMDAANILDHEELHVWNITRGTRFVTYAIEGERQSGVVCINGAAAHLCEPGDLVILAAFGTFTEEEARRHVPRVVRVDERNRMVSDAPEIPGPATPVGGAGVR